MVLQQEFFLSCPCLTSLCLQQDWSIIASMCQPPLEVSRLFSGSYFPYIALLCYLQFFCTQGGSLVIFFPFCAAEVLPCQLRHQGIKQSIIPAWIRARLPCRALPGPASPLDQHPPSSPRGRARPLLGWSRTTGRCQHWDSLVVQKSFFLPCFTEHLWHPCAQSAGEEEQAVVFSGMLLPGIQKQNIFLAWSAVALLSPSCGMPALQRIMPSLSFLLLDYCCTAGIQSWVQDGTSSNPSLALLMPFLWVGPNVIWFGTLYSLTQINSGLN